MALGVCGPLCAAELLQRVSMPAVLGAGLACLPLLLALQPCLAAPRLTTHRSTFYRVWAFLILEFHFMAVMLWG